MKRDIEFLKEVLMKIEESDDNMDIVFAMKQLGYEEKYIWQQLTIMDNAKLFLNPSATFESFYVNLLTQKGYDLLEKVKNKKTWNKLQKNIDKGNLNKIAEILGTFLGSFVSAYFKKEK